VKLAAVNCDEEENKMFCGSMGIQGFPTLKVVKPGKKFGSPIVEDYQGPRDAKAIVDIMVGKIPNHVKKITDKDVDTFLSENNSTAKAILFTEKGTISAMLKALAVDFLGSITIGQVRNKETMAVEKFGVTKFPTLILLPGGDTEAIVYDGKINKDDMVAFLAQVAAPNPDPAPAKIKMPKKKEDKKEKAAKEAFESSSSSHQASEASSGAASATEETLEEASQPTESPSPVEEIKEKPVVIEEVIPPIPTLGSTLELVKACLMPGASTCVLAFVPKENNEIIKLALSSLAEIAHKHKQARRNLFPFYAVPDDTTEAAAVKKNLGWNGEVVIIAVNRKRGWYVGYEEKDVSAESIEVWIDKIRMGEVKKQKLPEHMAEKPGNAATDVPLETPAEEVSDDPTAAIVEESFVAEESPEATKHDEL
jgi:protein disulfide-isomerase A6